MAAVADLESPEALAVCLCMHPQCSGGEDHDPCCAMLADQLRKRDAAIRERERDGFRERLRLLLGRIDHAITELAGAGNEVQEAVDGEWIESDSTENRVRRDDRGCVVVTWRLDSDDLAFLAADTVTSDVRELAQATLATLDADHGQGPDGEGMGLPAASSGPSLPSEVKRG